MTHDLEYLYRELSQNLTEKRLGALTTKLIAAHRDRNHGLIRAAAAVLLDSDIETESETAIFLRVIKQCHPDRTRALQKEAERAFTSGDRDSLLRLGRLFLAEKETSSAVLRKQVPSYHEPETYEAEPDFTFDPGSYNFEDYLEEEDEAWIEEEEITFLSALREELIGNLDIPLSPADLVQLDGELDLSARELTELKGLEYCRNIEILNLSENGLGHIAEVVSLRLLRELYLEGNDISDLSPLIRLPHLEILDASHNDVEDLSPLLKCEGLRFADLRHNPLNHQEGIIRLLEEKGVVLLV